MRAYRCCANCKKTLAYSFGSATNVVFLKARRVNLTDQLISQTIAADEDWTEADTDAGCVSVENECLVRIIVNEVMNDINGLTE